MWHTCPIGFLALWDQGGTYVCSPWNLELQTASKWVSLEAGVHLAWYPRANWMAMDANKGPLALHPGLSWPCLPGEADVLGWRRASLGCFCLVASGPCLSLFVDLSGGCPILSLASVVCGTGDRGALSLPSQRSHV